MDIDVAERPPGSGGSDSEDWVLQCLLTRSDRTIQNIMERRADPNMIIGPTTVTGMQLTFCTPLAIAVMRNKVPLVQWLIQFSADPDSQYGFIAGGAGMEWSGPCSHATVANANMPCLQALIAARADIHTPASNMATLLWQAAYFNQPAIVEYLIAEGAHLEQKAISADSPEEHYTPLHSAAKGGHHQVVAKLLTAKANCDPKSRESDRRGSVDGSSAAAEFIYGEGIGPGRSALEDAIGNGHVRVVRLLVESGAESLCDREHHRCLDLAFKSGNAALVTNVIMEA